MKYMLIIQFFGNTMSDYDALVSLEDDLIERIGELGEVDGHDFGVGEMNIFVVTDEPIRAFALLRQIVDTHGKLSGMRAAYREMSSDEYTILWPKGLAQFDVL